MAIEIISELAHRDKNYCSASLCEFYSVMQWDWVDCFKKINEVMLYIINVCMYVHNYVCMFFCFCVSIYVLFSYLSVYVHAYIIIVIKYLYRPKATWNQRRSYLYLCNCAWIMSVIRGISLGLKLPQKRIRSCYKSLKRIKYVNNQWKPRNNNFLKYFPG